MATANTESPVDVELHQEGFASKGEMASRAAGRCSRLTSKKALVGISAIGLVLVAVIIGITCHFVLRHQSSTAKGALDDYSILPFHEVARAKAAAVLNDTTLEECARNCSKQEKLDCVHIQFCAPEASDNGQCQLFAEKGRVRTMFSETCNFYTRGNPEDAGIPHSGAPSLRTGLPKWLLWIVLLLVVWSRFDGE